MARFSVPRVGRPNDLKTIVNSVTAQRRATAVATAKARPKSATLTSATATSASATSATTNGGCYSRPSNKKSVMDLGRSATSGDLMQAVSDDQV